MITVRFQCGHTRTLNGDEQQPRCACGETVIAEVNAPAPRFRGYALGPCAKFEELPAKAVSFVEKKES